MADLLERRTSCPAPSFAPSRASMEEGVLARGAHRRRGCSQERSSPEEGDSPEELARGGGARQLSEKGDSIEQQRRRRQLRMAMRRRQHCVMANNQRRAGGWRRGQKCHLSHLLSPRIREMNKIIGAVCYDKCTWFCNGTGQISFLAVFINIIHILTVSCTKIFKKKTTVYSLTRVCCGQQ
jgi:hypothetical protein